MRVFSYPEKNISGWNEDIGLTQESDSVWREDGDTVERIRPSEIEKYICVRARLVPPRIGRGADIKFINKNAIPRKRIDIKFINKNAIPRKK